MADKKIFQIKTSITLGLVVHNEAQRLPTLFQNLQNVLSSSEANVILVDNASTDTSLDLCTHWQQAHPGWNIHIIARAENHMAKARNDILTHAQTSWIFYTDADCRISSATWKTLNNFLETTALNENIGAFGGGNFPGGDDSFLKTALIEMKRNWLAHMGSIQLRCPDKVQNVSLLSTSNFILRTSAGIDCKGCDTHFHPVGEDLSLCYRLQRKGYRLLTVPGIDVEHLHRPSLIQWMRKMYSYGRAQINVAMSYPEHFRGARGLQFLLALILFSLILLKPILLIYLSFFYLMIFLTLAFAGGSRNLQKIIHGAILSAISHACYFAGEVDSTGRLIYSKGVQLFQPKFPLEKE